MEAPLVARSGRLERAAPLALVVRGRHLPVSPRSSSSRRSSRWAMSWPWGG